MSIAQDILASAIGAIPGIVLAMWVGYRRGINSKRPPKHAHEWGRWDNYKTVRIIWDKPDEFMGYQYFYIRECSTCGEHEHNTKETR